MTVHAPSRTALPVAVLLLLGGAAPASGQDAPPAPRPATPTAAPGSPSATPAPPGHAVPHRPSPPAPRPGYLGVVLEEVTAEDVRQLDLPAERGALVKRVVDGSPADSAGFRPDDVVLRWAGESVFSAAELSRLVRETPPGREVRVRVYRDGERRRLTVVPAERRGRDLVPGRLPPEAKIRVRERLEDARHRLEGLDEKMEHWEKHMEHAEERMSEADERMRHAWERAADSLDLHVFRFGPDPDEARLGVRLQDLTPQLADYFGLGDRTGVLVASVRDGSPAEEAGLRAGDVLLSAAGRDVEDAGDAAEAVSDASGEIELRVLRRGEERTLTARLPEDEEEPEGEEGREERNG